jgi:murein DD-endopeptidase MepM/ murein hydrolase activator NlpD
VGGTGRDDLGLGALDREIHADAARIRRRSLGKKAARVGAKAAVFLALAFVLLVAFPPFAWPIRGRVTSALFFRHKPDSNMPLAMEFHRGLDIAAAAGTEIHAAAPGLVIEAGYSPDLGNFVRIRHLFGVTSSYGHLSRIDTAKGRVIILRGIRGIGAVGSTGRSTGPHLHFSLQAGRLPIPPRAALFFHSLRRAVVGF